ncbi:MAG: penicillin acylase family protein [Gemmatimonadetes bacterium]|nr:penicillin acylase family protein [Gemmatimonadota bacterium]
MAILTALLLALPFVGGATAAATPPAYQAIDSTVEAAIAARAEIVRTQYGVPHITAQDFEALGFAMAWVQSEDYGDRVARRLVKARGEYAKYVGHDSIDGDFAAWPVHAHAVSTFNQLDEDTRAVYEGFAAGVDYYVRLHRSAFPEWMPTDFTGPDAAALDGQTWSRSDARRFVQRMGADAGSVEGGDDLFQDHVDFGLEGSNAWAFGGTRTVSGRPILLRNPHLSWTAGYYEAQARVPGKLDFYGDFRIGGPFGIIGGFNRHLGWATTNNYPTYSKVYGLWTESQHPDYYFLDGGFHHIDVRSVTIQYRTADGRLASETRNSEWTPYGPVILRKDGQIYVLTDPRDGEFRRGEQFLRLMQTTNFDEWLDVMRMRAHPSSNFTYADAAGNIAHLYNANLPLIPDSLTGDTVPVVRSSADIWSELVPFDDLPLYLDPPGGYVHQENDTPDYTNLNVPMDRDTMPANLPAPRLRLRSQLALSVINGATEKLGLQDVIRMKHTHRMLMAERVMDELIAAVRASQPVGDVARALEVLERWDRSADANSRGGEIFEAWARRYAAAADSGAFYRVPWSPDRPTETPVGIGSPDAAVAALAQAVSDLAQLGIPLDAPWGDWHRVRRGSVDEPVSGCPATLGCFRALNFHRDPDGKLVADGADGWILAVEFDDVPRAFSVLAYGESDQEDSPHFDDQAAMFAHEKLKPVAFTDEDIRKTTIARYRPGEDPPTP